MAAMPTTAFCRSNMLRIETRLFASLVKDMLDMHWIDYHRSYLFDRLLATSALLLPTSLVIFSIGTIWNDIPLFVA